MSKLVDYPEWLPKPTRFITAVAQKMQSSRIPDIELEIAMDWLKQQINARYEKELEDIEKQEAQMESKPELDEDNEQN